MRSTLVKLAAAVAIVASGEAFQAPAAASLRPLAANGKMCSRSSQTRLSMSSGLDALQKKVKDIELEGLRNDLLILCDQTKRGVTSPEGSEERAKIVELIERLETMNPESNPLASDVINGQWRLRWTTSESILGRNRMRGFRVDLNRPIFQDIDAEALTARNEEPITSFRWIFGGVKYTNNVQAELTPLSNSKVAVQFKTFNLFGGLLSFNAPERARGELDTTYLDSGMVCSVDGSISDSIRISRGDRGNLFVLTKKAN